MQRRLALVSFVCSVLGSSACSVPSYDEIGGITVVAAELDGWFAGGGFFGGGGAGDASLEALTSDGELLHLDLRLTVGAAGLLFDGYTNGFDDRPLSIPSAGVPLDQLLEVYRCETIGGHAFVGYVTRSCAAGPVTVELDAMGAGFGFAIPAYEWIALAWDDADGDAGPGAPLAPADAGP